MSDREPPETHEDPDPHDPDVQDMVLRRPDESSFEYAGPDDAPPRLDDPNLPGGIDQTTAAVGAGIVGAFLLALAGFFKRRLWRHRLRDLDA